MIDSGNPPPPISREDRELAALAEEITRRLESGETVDPNDYQHAYPNLGAPIRGLIPTLHTLVELGWAINPGPGVDDDPQERKAISWFGDLD